jgi:hypothetical protein
MIDKEADDDAHAADGLLLRCRPFTDRQTAAARAPRFAEVARLSRRGACRGPDGLRGAEATFFSKAIRCLLGRRPGPGLDGVRQRTDEVLLDIDDVALGHASVMRWNPKDKWITSAQPAHPPLIDQEHLDRAQVILAGRSRRQPGTPNRSRRTYILKGLIHRGVCERTMQGQYSHDAAYYRCRFPQEYALANTIDHPRNIYLREEPLIHPLDHWLASAFDPPARETTITALHDAQDTADGPPPDNRHLTTIAELDNRIARYKATLDAERAQVAAQLNRRQRSARPARMTRREIADLVATLGDMVATLERADPNNKAEVYRHPGLYLRLDPTPTEPEPKPDWDLPVGLNDCVGGLTRPITPRLTILTTELLLA